MVKLPFLLNEHLVVNGRKIHCKVTGKPGSENDGKQYVLLITGGPGFSHASYQTYIENLTKTAAKKQFELPHYILFDPLGCGDSDHALNPEIEYTIDNFSDIAAGVVEAVKTKLNLPKMNLQIEGRSFGSLVAMNIPARRPNWTTGDNNIALKHLISHVGPSGVCELDYTLKYISERFGNHPHYEKMIAAVKKLFAGEIKDKADYIRFAAVVAQLYSKDVSSKIFSLLTKLLIAQPLTTTKIINGLDKLFKKFGAKNQTLSFLANGLNDCNYEVLNHFFKSEINHFNLFDVIKNNKSTYENIPISMVYNIDDHMVDPQIAEAIHSILPDNTLALFLKDVHMATKGAFVNLNHRLTIDWHAFGSYDIGLDDLSLIEKQLSGKDYTRKLMHIYMPTVSRKVSTSVINQELGISETTPQLTPVPANTVADIEEKATQSDTLVINKEAVNEIIDNRRLSVSI